jgi:hypothetical protein
MSKLLEQLKAGKKIVTVKHPEYNFIMKAKMKLDDGQTAPAISSIKISLPRKAGKGEKLLLKLVEMYCYDVLRGNLINDIQNSVEYHKFLTNYSLALPRRT